MAERKCAGKWYFAANLNALKHSFEQIQVAVKSARRNTRLAPYALIDNHQDLASVLPRLAWLEQAGVTLIRHKAELFAIVRQHFGQRADIFNGHWLRCDIPMLEQHDKFVLYTDIDVMFRKDIDIFAIAPPYLACAPEHHQGDHSYFSSGVMVMNVPALRETRSQFIEILRSRLGIMKPHNDQGVFNATYGEVWTPLSDHFNWKPYWGIDEDAAIVHFHGPKPRTARQLLENGEASCPNDLRKIFSRNPEGYRYYLAEFEDFLNGDEAGPLRRIGDFLAGQ